MFFSRYSKSKDQLKSGIVVLEVVLHIKFFFTSLKKVAYPCTENCNAVLQKRSF